MINKKILLGLDVPPLPKNRADAVYRAGMVRHILRAGLAMDGKVLVVAFYDREAALAGFCLPSAVLYQTQDDYRTLLRQDGQELWKKSRIGCVLEVDRYREAPAVCLRTRDERTIRKFLRLSRERYYWEEEDIVSHIQRCQTEILDRRNRARKAALAQRVDDYMKQVPALPAAFDRWLDREPLKASRYAYYRRLTKRKATCHCTHCKQTFQVTAKPLPKHNGRGVCPACKSVVTFKAMGITKQVYDEEYTAILQRTKMDSFVLRFFRSARTFSDWETKDTLSHERARLFFTPQGEIVGQYKYGHNITTGRYGWYPTKDRITGQHIAWEIPLAIYARTWNHWFMPSFLYPYNVRPMLGALGLSYGTRERICGKPVNATTYLLQSIKYPIEQLLSAQGMTKLAEDLYENGRDLACRNRTGKLCWRLGIPKDALPLITAYDLGADGVNWLARLHELSAEKKQKRMPTEQDMTWVKRHELPLDALSTVLGHATFHRVRKYLFAQRRRIRELNRQEKAEMVREGRQPYNRYSEALANRLKLWVDYLEMAGEVGWNVTEKPVLFPADLQREHDVVQQLVQVKINQAVDLKIQALYQPLAARYAFATDIFLIRPPKTFAEYIEEGNTLRHCLAANKYYEKHIAGKTLNFFIRKVDQPDTPFYTVEYDPGSNRVLQCQGHRHQAATDEVQSFVEQWLERVSGAVAA